MAKLVIQNLSKAYDKKTNILNNINIEVQETEFVVLVGPSGCGKSTLLRSIAGLETVTSGKIFINKKDVTELEPANRDIAMVFQDYALYPHLTVRENMSFALKIKKLPLADIEERVLSTSKMLDIEHLLERKPAQLSGGQRQRVAIGRAIVRKPGIFLFDEPLSNLDAQLRMQTRVELAALHQKIKSTSVYVTHDQVEAMTLADRIVVLNKGVVQQQGSPLTLYHHPANKFVAAFIGNPSMNFLEGELYLGDKEKVFKFQNIHIDFSDAPTPQRAGKYILGIRPESFKVLAKDGREAVGKRDVEVEVLLKESHGHEIHLIGRLGTQQIIVRSANPHRLEMMEKAHSGDKLATTIDRAALHWFFLEGDQERVPTV